MGDGLYDEELDTELVPLSVAAAVADFHLTGAGTLVSQADLLTRDVLSAAMVLAQVAVLHLRTAGGVARQLSAQEVEELLLRPIRQRSERPDLDHFLIRRNELRRALISLRQAAAALPRQ